MGRFTLSSVATLKKDGKFLAQKLPTITWFIAGDEPISETIRTDMEVRVKMNPDSYCTSSLRFMLTDSSFFRRFVLATTELEFGLESVGNYGYPQEIEIEDSGDRVIVFRKNYTYRNLEEARLDIESIINSRRDYDV